MGPIFINNYPVNRHCMSVRGPYVKCTLDISYNFIDQKLALDSPPTTHL